MQFSSNRSLSLSLGVSNNHLNIYIYVRNTQPDTKPPSVWESWASNDICGLLSSATLKTRTSGVKHATGSMHCYYPASRPDDSRIVPASIAINVWSPLTIISTRPYSCVCHIFNLLSSEQLPATAVSVDGPPALSRFSTIRIRPVAPTGERYAGTPPPVAGTIRTANVVVVVVGRAAGICCRNGLCRTIGEWTKCDIVLVGWTIRCG